MKGLLGLNLLGRCDDGLSDGFEQLLRAAAREAQREATLRRLLEAGWSQSGTASEPEPTPVVVPGQYLNPRSNDMPNKEKGLDDLFYDTLRDIYYAERKILKALPKMARGASSPELKAAFDKHRDQTEGHVERLQQVFDLLGKRAQGKTCPAIDGIIEEGEEILEEFKGTAAGDAGLISAAQAVEHYEITRYGTLRRWAEIMKMPDAAKLFAATLAEEETTDKDLTMLADSKANREALAA